MERIQLEIHIVRNIQRVRISLWKTWYHDILCLSGRAVLTKASESLEYQVSKPSESSRVGFSAGRFFALLSCESASTVVES